MLTNRESKRCLCVRRKVCRKASWRLLKKHEKVLPSKWDLSHWDVCHSNAFSPSQRGVWKGCECLKSKLFYLLHPYLAGGKALEWQISQWLKSHLLSNTFSCFFKSRQDAFLHTFLLTQRHLFDFLFVSMIVYHYLIYKFWK